MKQRYTIYALFLLSLFVSISASAQIKGVITDSLTNEPLMYITVQYEGKGVGGISNANGEYQVETRRRLYHQESKTETRHPGAERQTAIG